MRDTHPLAGKTVKLKVKGADPELVGQEYRVEDWWQTVGEGSWMNAVGNPACLKYAVRSALCGLPIDDEVVYGKVGNLGHLIHVSELGEEVVKEKVT